MIIVVNGTPLRIHECSLKRDHFNYINGTFHPFQPSIFQWGYIFVSFQMSICTTQHSTPTPSMSRASTRSFHGQIPPQWPGCTGDAWLHRPNKTSKHGSLNSNKNQWGSMEPYMGIAFFLSTKSGSATVWVGRKNFTNFGSNPSLLETSYQLLHPPSPPKNNKNMSSH